MLAQAALQNQTLSFSTIMKLYSSCSLAEKQRFVENNEKELMERNQQQQQQQMQIEQEKIQQQAQIEQAKMQQEDMLNQRDNETKILIAEIQARNKENDGIVEPNEDAKANLMEKMREFDQKIKLDRERLEFDKQKAKKDAELKQKQINKQRTNTK